MLPSLLLILAAAGLVSAQTIESLPKCGQDCINNVKAESNSLGCAGGALGCLCALPNYGFGIRDCAIQNCGAELASTVTNAASAECATGTIVHASSSQAPVTTSAQPPVTTSGVPTTSISSKPLSDAAQGVITTTTQISTSQSSAVSSSAPHSTTTSSASPTAASTTTDGLGGILVATTESSTGTKPASTASSTASTPSSATASAVANDAGSNFNRLSIGAKAGIGIGAAAVASAIISIAVCAVMRKRQGRTQSTYLSSLKISEPLPGSGRQYANDVHYNSDGSELELKGHRYEDMVPRIKPRHMV